MSVQPQQIKFAQAAALAYHEPSPPLLRDVVETFDADTGQFTKFTENINGTMMLTGGQVTISNNAGADRNDLIVVGSAPTAPQVFVSIDIVTRSGSPSGYDNIGVGLIKDSNNFVLASVDRLAAEVRLQIKIGGTKNFYVGVSRAIGPGQKLGFALVGNVATIYVHDGASWRYVTGRDISDRIAFKTAGMAGWRGGFVVATPGGGASWTFDNLIVGRFGGVGIRDLSVVTDEVGQPHIVGGKVYALATCVDGLGTGYQAVIRVPVNAPYGIEQTAVIMVSRDGAVQNDLAGHLVMRDSGIEQTLTIGTWGNGFNNPIDTHIATVTTNLLGGTHLVATSKLALPVPAGKAAYDGFLVRDGSTWRLAYTICDNLTFAGSPFYSALATSPDLVTWTQAATDPTTVYEGTKFVRLRDQLFIVAGTRTVSRAYDKALTYLGNVDAAFVGGTETQPHPMIYQAGAFDARMLTFDNNRSFPGVTASFTWGRLLVHEGILPDVVTGEFDFELPGMQVLAGESGEIDFDLPLIEVSAYGGALADCILPGLTVEAEGTVQVLARVDFSLPVLIVETQAAVGVTGEFELGLPALIVEAVGGGWLDFMLPAALEIEAAADVSGVGEFGFSLPGFEVEARGIVGLVGLFDFDLPALQSVAEAVFDFDLPMLQVLATGHVGDDFPVYEAYCTNLRTDIENGGHEMTRFTEFPLLRVLRFNGRYYGLAPDGLHRLGGARDGAEPIRWAVSTGTTDFGTRELKHLPSVYVGGRLGPGARFTVHEGEKRDVAYSYTTPRGQTAQNYRQLFGKGLRARYYSFTLAGDDEFELDGLHFEVAASKRRI